jgi:hypothetical protein
MQFFSAQPHCWSSLYSSWDRHWQRKRRGGRCLALSRTRSDPFQRSGWGHAQRSYVPGFLMISTITVFGAVRFGVRALAESVPILAAGTRLRWFLLFVLVGVIAWLPIHQDAFQTPFEWAATCLAVTAALLRADFATSRWRVERVRKVDWVGVAALLAGCATPLYVPNWIVGATADVGWHQWLLPSYGVGFLVCLSGRAVQKVAMARLSS